MTRSISGYENLAAGASGFKLSDMAYKDGVMNIKVGLSLCEYRGLCG